MAYILDNNGNKLDVNSFMGMNEHKADFYFKKAIRTILDEGVKDENPRPKWHDGTLAHTLFTTQYIERYDISKGEFPITTVKPTAWKNAIKEILWIFQEASNDINLLEEKYGIKWWRDWVVSDGETIGYRYGHTVNRYDLMNKLLDGIKNDPYGRRHIISLWQEQEFNEGEGLHPCAFQTLWSVRGEYLDCTLIQRSNDVIAAYDVNNTQYTALLMMVAKHCGYKPGMFVRFVQNIHIYDRHIEAAKEFLSRESEMIKHPKLIFEPKSDNFYDFTIDDFRIEDYNPKERIKIELAV